MISILNDAYTQKNYGVLLKRMVHKIFEVNRITFTNDELPTKGSNHNKTLHINIKCEGRYINEAMIDGGSGVNIIPLSTLQSLKISIDRINLIMCVFGILMV